MSKEPPKEPPKVIGGTTLRIFFEPWGPKTIELMTKVITLVKWLKAASKTVVIFIKKLVTVLALNKSSCRWTFKMFNWRAKSRTNWTSLRLRMMAFIFCRTWSSGYMHLTFMPVLRPQAVSHFTKENLSEEKVGLPLYHGHQFRTWKIIYMRFYLMPGQAKVVGCIWQFSWIHLTTENLN